MISFGVGDPGPYPGEGCGIDQPSLSDRFHQIPYPPTPSQGDSPIPLATFDSHQAPSFGKSKEVEKSRLKCNHKGCTKSFIRQGRPQPP